MAPKVSDEYLEERKQEIICAAEICFANQGIHGTTLEDIRSEAGVSKGAVYHYFKSKEDIVDGLRDRSQSEDTTKLEDVVKDGSPFDNVCNVFAFAANRNLGKRRNVDARVALFLWAEALINERIMASQMRLMNEPRDVVRDLIKQAQADGDIAIDLEPDGIIDALIAFAFGMTVLGAWNPDWDQAAGMRAMEALIAGNFRGPAAD
ncbi:MAG: TetR/AcrR family transcriptional regulator [Chloroflexi bacterium]|nr:TetR/AcrR family transcriptional regulator [Chloroflexota bacterium]